ncbi:DMT family transporter [Myxococcota bacterium]|nr:DMT family transporter [Myxococcota bacterium]
MTAARTANDASPELGVPPAAAPTQRSTGGGDLSLAAYLGLAFLTVVWGTQFLVIKVGHRGAPPLLGVALRFGILAVVSEVAIHATGARARGGPPMRTLRLAYGAAQAACMSLLYWAQARMSSSIAGVVLATTPFFVAWLAHLVLPDEPLSRPKLWATSLGFAGVGAVLLGDVRDTPTAPAIAVVAVVGAAIFGAVNKVLSKRLTVVLPAPVMLRDLGLVVAVSAGLASLALERDLATHLSVETLTAALYLGLVGSAVASAIYLRLLRTVAVTSLAYLQFVTAVVAVLAGVTIGAEALRPITVLGIGLVLAGLFVLARDAHRRSGGGLGGERPSVAERPHV